MGGYVASAKNNSSVYRTMNSVTKGCFFVVEQCMPARWLRCNELAASLLKKVTEASWVEGLSLPDGP